MRTLLIGYGNPARGDDGLGPALAEALAALALPGLTVEADYQLSVDHAALVAAHDRIVYADAALGLEAPFRLAPLTGPPGDLGSHSLSPAGVQGLAALLYGAAPPAWVLELGGEAFGEISEGLSPQAEANLRAALAALTAWLRA